jgi:hypothetical protein
MRSEQVIREFEKFVSKRAWYKCLGIDRYRASGVKRRFKSGELGFQTIVKYLKDADYKILALPPIIKNDNFKLVSYSLTDQQIELLKIVGYFDNLTETPNVNGAIDYLRQRYDIMCSVNLFWDSKDKDIPYKYSYVLLDPFHNNKCHSGGMFTDYYSAAAHLLDELLALDL